MSSGGMAWDEKKIDVVPASSQRSPVEEMARQERRRLTFGLLFHSSLHFQTPDLQRSYFSAYSTFIIPSYAR